MREDEIDAAGMITMGMSQNNITHRRIADRFQQGPVRGCGCRQRGIDDDVAFRGGHHQRVAKTGRLVDLFVNLQSCRLAASIHHWIGSQGYLGGQHWRTDCGDQPKEFNVHI